MHGDQLVMVHDDGRVVAINDTLHSVLGKVSVRDRESGKVLLSREYAVNPNATLVLGVVSWSGQGILDMEYEQDGVSGWNWYLYGKPTFDLDQVIKWLRPCYKRLKSVR